MAKLLVVSPDYPFPMNHGFRVRVGDMCRALGAHSEQHLLIHGQPDGPLVDRDFFESVTVSPTPPIPTGARGLLRRLTRRWNPPLLDDPTYAPDALLEVVAALHRRHEFDACLVHTPSLARCFHALPADVMRVVDAHDLWYEKYACFQELGSGGILAHCRDRERELAIYRNADLTLAISLHDHREMVRQGVNAGRVLHVPVSFPARPLPSTTEEPVLLYAAGSGEFNIDAVRHFVERILPLVRSSVPAARLHIMGAGREIRKAYGDRSDVHLLPYLDDVSEAYAGTRLVVVPLRYGTGLKIKVLESFSYGCPTVLSEAAIQGVAVDHYPQESLSIEPASFAREVVRGLQCDEQRTALIDAGLDAIREHYTVDAAYGELIERLSSSRGEPNLNSLPLATEPS